MAKTSKVQKLGRNLVDLFLGPEERLIKKYALNGDGKLMVRDCPEVQATLLKVCRDNGLIDLLKAREEAEDTED